MEQTVAFVKTLEDFFVQHGRDLPWRKPEPNGNFDAYKILVSEFMLQQTQVSRVIPRYETFLTQFPAIDSLAQANLPEVIRAWLGLGYNRRAKYLWQAAYKLSKITKHWDFQVLSSCKGIGPNTAAAILAYAYDEAAVFIETNIRTVIIHHFFAGKQEVDDKEILAIVEEILYWVQGTKSPLASPRQFYWAMMDYGTFLKASVGNLNKQSKSYTKQSKFAGSKRQLRGQVLRMLVIGPQKISELQTAIPDKRLEAVIKELAAEELVSLQDQMLMLYNKKING